MSTAEKKAGYENLLLAGLVLLALILGSAIVNKYNPLNINLSSALKADTKKTAVAPSNQNQPTGISVTGFPDLSDSDAVKKHHDLLVAQAQSADVLDVTNCAPKPLVLKAKEKGKITLKNTSDQTITLGVEPSHFVVVQPKTNGPAEVDFSHGPGDYGYTCNNSSAVVGVFLVD